MADLGNPVRIKCLPSLALSIARQRSTTNKAINLAALACNTVGDTTKAREHAEKALEAGLVNNGHGSGEEGDESEMRGLLGWPEGYWSFMARRR